jgi:2-(1,2-epoxy-1,2-dihydrophenyl)acetyl-CoA isomerase
VETILIEREAGVVEVTMHRPEKRNALSRQMIEELTVALRDIAADDVDRVLVLRGAGPAFCAGADLTGPDAPGRSPQTPVVRMRRFTELMLALHRMPIPTVAVVDGPAIGGGSSLALCCDLVIASTRATFAQVFVRRGLSLDLGSSWLLPRLIGLHKAKQLALLGDTLDAAEAERIGLVSCLVAEEALEATVAEWTRRLADGPSVAMRLDKQLLNQTWSLTFEQALEIEAMAQAVNIPSPDAAEALAAFLERREPVFRR